MFEEEPAAEAWDCDLFATASIRPYDADLDEEDATGDWQVLALDRFGDRLVNGEF